jgi:hypothetical protein
MALMEPRMRPQSLARARSLIVPLIVLVAVSLVAGAALHYVTRGGEIADDILSLRKFVQRPLILWGDYRAAGLSDNWGSFPPLFPPFFALLVYPWVRMDPGFWGFRLGVLSWALVALVAVAFLLERCASIPAGRRRSLLMVFALLPAVWGTVALIPQEEIFVSLFVVILFAAAAAGRWRLVPYLLLASVLAGKYFLLALAAPMAIASPAPRKNLVAWCALSAAALTAYVAFHRVAHGLLPIVGHVIDPHASISIWALLWNLGWTMPPRIINAISLVTVAIFVLLYARASIGRGRPLAFTFAGTLIGMLLLLSVAVPGYILWAVPVLLVSIGLMRERAHRVWVILLLFVWGASEWGANFFRGVALALGTDRPAGKETLASFAEHLLGGGFPFSLAHVAFLCLVVAAGLGLLGLLWSAPVHEETARRSGENHS